MGHGVCAGSMPGESGFLVVHMAVLPCELISVGRGSVFIPFHLRFMVGSAHVHRVGLVRMFSSVVATGDFISCDSLNVREV